MNEDAIKKEVNRDIPGTERKHREQGAIIVKKVG
jgi:hypothetical protein